MKLLFLGGTRFSGKALAARFIDEGAEVTVLSRRADGAPPGASVIAGERSACLHRVRDTSFDAAFDFSCYDAEQAAEAHDALEVGAYILISTAWTTKLTGSPKIGDPVTELPQYLPAGMTAEMFRYISGKVSAENETMRRKDRGAHSTIVRLPIIWGVGDHTKRYIFYRNRLSGGRPLILVDGGANVAQIIWREDLVDVLSKWLTGTNPLANAIWEGIPDSGLTVADVAQCIAGSIKSKSPFVAFSSGELAKMLPEYLKVEPLWREEAVQKSGVNIFDAIGHSATPMATWLSWLSTKEKRTETVDPALRRREIQLLDSWIDA